MKYPTFRVLAPKLQVNNGTLLYILRYGISGGGQVLSRFSHSVEKDGATVMYFTTLFGGEHLYPYPVEKDIWKKTAHLKYTKGKVRNLSEKA